MNTQARTSSYFYSYKPSFFWKQKFKANFSPFWRIFGVWAKSISGKLIQQSIWEFWDMTKASGKLIQNRAFSPKTLFYFRGIPGKLIQIKDGRLMPWFFAKIVLIKFLWMGFPEIGLCLLKQKFREKSLDEFFRICQ